LVDPASLKATLGGIQKPISRLCLLPSLQLFLHTQRLLPIYNTNNHFSCRLVSPSRGLPLRKNVSTPGKHPHSISRALYHLALSIYTLHHLPLRNAAEVAHSIIAPQSHTFPCSREQPHVQLQARTTSISNFYSRSLRPGLRFCTRDQGKSYLFNTLVLPLFTSIHSPSSALRTKTSSKGAIA
jgi:hypothetical protein